MNKDWPGFIKVPIPFDNMKELLGKEKEKGILNRLKGRFKNRRYPGNPLVVKDMELVIDQDDWRD